MEKPLYPSSYMRITQGYMVGSHLDSYAIDEAGKDTGIDEIKAPFTGTIKKIYKTGANEVWLESIDKVEYPDGTVDYMTVLFCHDNNVDDLFIGKVIKQGEIFYQEGTKGNASGNHCHIECAKGKFSQTGWHKNTAGFWSINNGKKPEECLWIDDSITIINSRGYQFKKIEKKQTDTSISQKEVPINEIPSNEKKETIETPTKKNLNLIFTCNQDDTYAIKLKKGQKLYLE